MKYPKTIIKFEGDLKTQTAHDVRGALVLIGKKVCWTDSHELTVIHKGGKVKEENK